jgi:glutathione S-transferase
MILRTSVTSPFGRKVRMAAIVLGVDGRFEVVHADTRDPQDSLRQQNPLGKIPCLLLDDGTALYDSRTIIEFLESIAGGKRLAPRDGPARFHALTRAALAEGIMDAAILMVYEGRYRASLAGSEVWLDLQRGKIARALGAFERAPPAATPVDIVSIGLACALGYLDWRQPVEWRPAHPGLVAWLDRFAKDVPAFERTRAT